MESIMNTPIAEKNSLDVHKQSHAPLQSAVYEKTHENTNSKLLNSCIEPSEILDQHFALQNGSHNDVKEYVIYFRHIMVFFQDGSHCGLVQPKQFVAFLGCKDKPESIVLKKDGVHIEVVLNARTRGSGAMHIQFPTQSSYTSTAGDDYFVA